MFPVINTSFSNILDIVKLVPSILITLSEHLTEIFEY